MPPEDDPRDEQQTHPCRLCDGTGHDPLTAIVIVRVEEPPESPDGHSPAGFFVRAQEEASGSYVHVRHHTKTLSDAVKIWVHIGTGRSTLWAHCRKDSDSSRFIESEWTDDGVIARWSSW